MAEEMSVVRGLCEGIAAQVLGVQVSEVRRVVSERSGRIVGIDWDKLLEFIEGLAAIIMQIFATCPVMGNRIYRVVQNPGFGQRVRVRMVARQYLSDCSTGTVNWREFVGKATDAILEAGKAASDETINAVLSEVREYTGESS